MTNHTDVIAVMFLMVTKRKILYHIGSNFCKVRDFWVCFQWSLLLLNMNLLFLAGKGVSLKVRAFVQVFM